MNYNIYLKNYTYWITEGTWEDATYLSTVCLDKDDRIPCRLGALGDNTYSLCLAAINSKMTITEVRKAVEEIGCDPSILSAAIQASDKVEYDSVFDSWLHSYPEEATPYVKAYATSIGLPSDQYLKALQWAYSSKLRIIYYDGYRIAVNYKEKEIEVDGVRIELTSLLARAISLENYDIVIHHIKSEESISFQWLFIFSLIFLISLITWMYT